MRLTPCCTASCPPAGFCAPAKSEPEHAAREKGRSGAATEPVSELFRALFRTLFHSLPTGPALSSPVPLSAKEDGTERLEEVCREA